jgi:hypothetical protein
VRDDAARVRDAEGHFPLPALELALYRAHNEMREAAKVRYDDAAKHAEAVAKEHGDAAEELKGLLEDLRRAADAADEAA